MSNHMPMFQSMFRFVHDFVLAKLATSSIRVNPFNATHATKPGEHDRIYVCDILVIKLICRRAFLANHNDYKVRTLDNWLTQCSSRFKVHFDMSLDYGGSVL